MAKTPSDKDPEDGKVGYGKPPAHSRFKQGQSGNPSGKKKGTINFETALKTVFCEELSIVERGIEVKRQAFIFLLMKLRHDSLRGDRRLMELALKLLQRYSDSEPNSNSELPEEDEAILRRSLGGSSGSDPSSDPDEDLPDDDPGGRDG